MQNTPKRDWAGSDCRMSSNVGILWMNVNLRFYIKVAIGNIQTVIIDYYDYFLIKINLK